MKDCAISKRAVRTVLSQCRLVCCFEQTQCRR